MSTLTVRGLDDDVKAGLRRLAAAHGRSMEAEARAIIEAALRAPEEDPTDLAAFARGLFAPLGGVELELPLREPARDPPDLGVREPAPVPPPAAEPVPPKPAPVEPAEGGGGRAKAPRRKAAPAGAGRRR